MLRCHFSWGVKLLLVLPSPGALAGACIYKAFAPNPTVECQDLNAQMCETRHRRSFGRYNHFFAQRNCAEVLQENTATARIIVNNFGTVLLLAERVGSTTGQAAIYSRELFAESSGLAGTAIGYEGISSFRVTRRGAGFQVLSLDGEIYPTSLDIGRIPKHLAGTAQALLQEAELTEFKFWGELSQAATGYQLRLAQYKEFIVRSTGEHGAMTSLSEGIVGNQGMFELKSTGFTYHPRLLEGAENPQ